MPSLPTADPWPTVGLRHLWHPYTQMATAPPPLAVERADGAWLHLADGRSILDGISSWWVTLHGHCEPRIAQAIAAQAARLDQIIFAGCTHEPAARLAARLAAIAPPGLSRVFFSDDGSTAVEVALKMAYQHWAQRGEPGRRRFVALEGAYHGDTVGAMAVSGIELFQATYRPLLFEVLRAPNPLLRPPLPGADSPLCPSLEAIRGLEELLERHPDEVAAIIVEPMVQGAAGMVIWPAVFLRELRALCDRHDTLLIADEVFTGFGRTGRRFACEHGAIAPDLLCLSKALTGGALPLAATLATEEIYRAFLSSDRQRTFFHGHSYTANPIACAAALASLDLLEDGGLERVAEIAAIHRERLARLEARAKGAQAKALGVIGRFEIAAPQLAAAGEGGASDATGYLDAAGPELQRRMLSRGVLLRPLGRVVYVLPPLRIRDAELHRIYDALEESLEELARSVG